jgi:hypothetical protein
LLFFSVYIQGFTLLLLLLLLLLLVVVVVVVVAAAAVLVLVGYGLDGRGSISSTVKAISSQSRVRL